MNAIPEVKHFLSEDRITLLTLIEAWKVAKIIDSAGWSWAWFKSIAQELLKLRDK